MPKGRSYNWALHLDATSIQLDDLSETAREGYEYAHQLAEDAFDRSRDPRRHIQLEPLTVEQLADWNDLEPAQLARLIALARRRLFGNLSDAAIYKRLQRQRGRKLRRCRHPGCTSRIAVTAPANKKYCDHHASGAERIRRHRQHNTSPPVQAVMATPAKTHATQADRKNSDQ
jgi:serine/threonine protein kinase HipA of HipAB toxin-antitoxin module